MGSEMCIRDSVLSLYESCFSNDPAAAKIDAALRESLTNGSYLVASYLFARNKTGKGLASDDEVVDVVKRMVKIFLCP